MFEDRAADYERLVAQGTVLDPLTRRLLVGAGLVPGMRVLDLGSGAGNSAMIAAELVGPDGMVIGIEGDLDALELARRRVAAAGVDNIEFRHGDVQTLEGVEAGFDAVIGRMILMYLSDPVDALRQAAARTRPGGVICMHESDLTYPWSSPQTPLWHRVNTWCLETLAKAGAEPRVGLALFPYFRAAGLPDPQLVLEAVIEGGPTARTWLCANVVSGVAPLMERLGVVTRSELDLATLAERLLAELVANDGVMIAPPFIGAWATVK
jgi:ubiquinone/menaquinone biosynthesis C-methylase UbiE